MSRLTLALGLALLVVEAGVAVALAATSANEQDWWSNGLALLAGVAFVVSGLIAITRRPENKTGVYLAAVGYTWFLGSLADSGNSWVAAAGNILGSLSFVAFAALLLSFPTGRFGSRFERAFPIIVGATFVGLTLVTSLVDPTPMPDCPRCAENPLDVVDWSGVASTLDAITNLMGVVLALTGVVLIVRRWRNAGPAMRRTLWPVLATGGFSLGVLAVFGIVYALTGSEIDALAPIFLASFAAVPIAFLSGILRTRLARSSVSELVVALDSGAPLRDALAQALGDPDLEVAYWLDWRRGLLGAGWVDSEGHAVPDPSSGGERAVTYVERDGVRIAALLYEPGLEAEPELVDAVSAAASLALQNNRLQAELRAEVGFMNTVTNTAPSLLVNIGTDGVIRNINVAAREASGLDDDEALRGQQYWDVFIAPSERAAVVARFNALSPDFPPGEYENTFVNARGEERTIYWRTAPVKDEQGRVVSIVSGGLDITERRKRELELERERDATTTALEAIPSIVVVLDHGGTIGDRDVENPRVGANRAFRQALGWRDHELVGRPFLDFIVGDDDGRAAGAIATAAAGGASDEVESELRCADGSLRAFAWTAVPVADVTGRADALVLVSGIEVTERRRLEADKERERQFLNAIANNAPSLLCLIDHDGRLTHMGANIAFEAALEYESAAIGGQVLWEQFVDPSEAEEVRGVIEDVVAGAAPKEHDNTWVASSGRRLAIAWTCTPLPQLDERKLLLITGVDITERKRREEEVRSAEERFRAVIERAPVAITEIGLDHTVKLWNPAAEHIFGWSADEVLGRPPRWVPEDRQAEFLALSDREAEGEGYTGFETIRMHRDGRRVDVEVAAAPIRDAEGNVMGAMAVLSDISDRKRQEEELRASRARLVAAGDDARRRLERNLHDGAQQRLVALSVALRLAESKLHDDPETTVEILAGAREELAHALEELRELARGIHPAILTDRGLGPALTALAARTPIPVHLTVYDARLPPGVEAASYYVVAEALTNVAKYADASEARVSVTSNDGRVVVEVADDGVGGADAAEGSGLRGLADRVAALDGTLVVESPTGKGTIVRAEIPLPVGISP